MKFDEDQGKRTRLRRAVQKCLPSLTKSGTGFTLGESIYLVPAGTDLSSLTECDRMSG